MLKFIKKIGLEPSINPDESFHPLLGHADSLYRLRAHKEIKPISVSLEMMYEDEQMPLEVLLRSAVDFRKLGCKMIALEGNGHLFEYRDSSSTKNIYGILQMLADFNYTILIRQSEMKLANPDRLTYKTDQIRWLSDESITSKITAPFSHACLMGGFAPKVMSYQSKYCVFICNVHAAGNNMKLDPDYILCEFDQIKETWAKMNQRLSEGKPPYEVRRNKGKRWDKTCSFCIHERANHLLHSLNLRIDNPTVL